MKIMSLKKVLALAAAMVLSCSFGMNMISAYADEKYVQNYNEESDIALTSYSTSEKMYLGLLNTDDEVCADVVITVEFEYEDESWVDISDVLLNIKCHNGYQVSVSSSKTFGGGRKQL